MGKFIKNLVVFAGIVLALGFIWDFFTAAPSTKSVCYTWSKATDPYLSFDEGGIDGAQWLADNLKTEEDLVSIDKDVLSAMRLYESGSFLDDVDGGDRLGLRQFVIDACEKVEPGSTDH